MTKSNKIVTIGTLGERIAELRNERGQTQAELADALHVNRVVLVYWEKGTRLPDIQHIINIADYFRVPCDWLMRGVTSENADIHRETGLSNKAIEALKKFEHHRVQKKQPCSFEKHSLVTVTGSVNKLLEELHDLGYEHGDTVLQAISTYLSTNIELDATFSTDSSTTHHILGRDIYTARLLDIQLALVRLKEGLDGRKNAK